MGARLLDIKTPEFPCVTITQEELKTNKVRVDAYFTEHPDTILLIEAAPENSLYITDKDIPGTVRHLKITGNHVTTIENNFLYNCTELTTIDLSGLSNVTTIGANFLLYHTKLTTIDLSFLSKATTIESEFLFGCRNLISIDFSPLSNVTRIGDLFLHGCHGLTTIDLNPLSNVIKIGESFLSSCSNLDKKSKEQIEQFKKERVKCR